MAVTKWVIKGLFKNVNCCIWMHCLYLAQVGCEYCHPAHPSSSKNIAVLFGGFLGHHWMCWGWGFAFQTLALQSIYYCFPPIVHSREPSPLHFSHTSALTDGTVAGDWGQYNTPQFAFEHLDSLQWRLWSVKQMSHHVSKFIYMNKIMLMCITASNW